MIRTVLKFVSLICLSTSLSFAKDSCEYIESDQITTVNKNISLAISKKEYTNTQLYRDAINTICSIEKLSSDNRYNYEHEWHDAHQLLGLVAFNQNDLEKAKIELLKSINRGKKSAVISSFGPHGELARLLLAKGFNKEVMQYLELSISISLSEKGENSRGQMECCLEKIRNNKNCNISESYPDHWFNLCK